MSTLTVIKINERLVTSRKKSRLVTTILFYEKKNMPKK